MDEVQGLQFTARRRRARHSERPRPVGVLSLHIEGTVHRETLVGANLEGDAGHVLPYRRSRPAAILRSRDTHQSDVTAVY